MIGRFPEMQRRFASDPLLGDLWDHFRGIMNGDRIGHFQKAGEDAVRMVVEGLNAHIEELPHLVVVPNPLQAPQVADFVRKKDRLYAVVAIARPLSIAHELLHSVFEKALARESALIAGYRHLFTPDVVTAMQRYQYAWDSGGESWLRVFEESLVRAATIWIAQRRHLEGLRGGGCRVSSRICLCARHTEDVRGEVAWPARSEAVYPGLPGNDVTPYSVSYSSNSLPQSGQNR